MKNEKKTLVILTPGFAASEADTTCLPMQQELVSTLKKLYANLDIIVLAFQYPYVVSTYGWHGVTVLSFNGRNKGGWKRWMLRKKINAALEKIYREKEVIGLLSFWYGECAVVGKMFAKKRGIRYGCWILGQDARKTNPYPARFPPEPYELIALSEFLQDEFEKNHGIKPATVIIPGVNSNRFRKEERPRNIEILAVGSLIPLKQYDVFIEIVAEIRKACPRIRAVIVGEGAEKNRLQAHVEALGLQKNIRFAGELPYDEVLELMHQSKILLHPSSYEGYSGVCMEALASGMQVVSFCRPMRADIDNWHIVKDREEMKKKALAIIQEHEIRVMPTKEFKIEDTAQMMMKYFS